MDAEDLHEKYRDGQRRLHPDFFANAPQEEQDAAAEQSTALNDAYSTLKDPLLRSQYMVGGCAFPSCRCRSPHTPNTRRARARRLERETDTQKRPNREKRTESHQAMTFPALTPHTHAPHTHNTQHPHAFTAHTHTHTHGHTQLLMHGVDAVGEAADTSVDPMLLMDVMEKREEIDKWRGHGDVDEARDALLALRDVVHKVRRRQREWRARREERPERKGLPKARERERVKRDRETTPPMNVILVCGELRVRLYISFGVSPPILNTHRIRVFAYP